VVWVGGMRVGVALGKLCAIQNGNVQCYGENGSLGRGVVGLYEDRKGNLWVGVETGLWRWSPGPPKFYPLEGNPDGIRGLGEDGDGTLLVGWKGGIQRFVDGKTEAYAVPGFDSQFTARRLLRDRDGGLWIGTSNRGLLHVHQGRADVFSLSAGLSDDNTSSNALFEDREGNIWVGTINGLDRFRDFAVATLTPKQGLSNGVVQSVLVTRDGSMWLSTRGGLDRRIDGQTKTYRIGTRLNDVPNSLLNDKDGRIWVSTPNGTGYLRNGSFIAVKGIPAGPVLSIVQDTAGNLWVANEHVGLFRLSPRGEVQQIPWSKLGHTDHASVLAADPEKSGIWIGFFLGGIAYFENGQIRASYTAADGLGAGRVGRLRFDPDGTLWVATQGGLSRLKNGRVATLSSRNGLPCDSVHWVIQDNDHSFWLFTPCGLVRIARSELDAWVAAVDQNKDTKPTIHASVFDSSDGVRSLASGGHFGPQVARTSDGRIWFLPWDGVSVVHPHNLHFNRLPPPVHVEQIIADRKTYDAASQLRLPPLVRDLQIDYTALSLAAPEKVRFRYKLEGFDSDWQDAGTRRQAFYTNLPPRDYRFRVMACNNSGVWNEAGATLDFFVAPAYYQTIWFRLSCLAGFLLLLVAVYGLWLRHLAAQYNMRLEERVGERTRIARELHDTLLQNVQGLILKLHAITLHMAKEDPARQDFEKALDHADQVLGEGRERVRSLRAGTLTFGELPRAFQRVVDEAAPDHASNYQIVVEGSLRELHSLVREESYAIGREALINAITHSRGQHIEAEIIYEPRQFRVRIRDDGRGIDPAILDTGGRADHWGLRGMRERAEKIGGKLQVWSRPGAGTEVELTVPASVAYGKASAKRKWFRRILASVTELGEQR
jgi:ligand-binding sensor domain-containing protein